MRETPAPRLVGTDLCTGYDGRQVLHEVDFAVREAELTVILGPNACGKSTLLKTLARVLRPGRGTVTLDGTPLPQLRSQEIARAVAMLPQSPAAPSGVTVGDVVARGRYPHQSLLRTWSAQDEEVCQRAMAACNVLDLAERPVEALSGGQRQRVWIAMTLAQDTPLVLLDEPTTYLDITHQIEVLNLTRRLHREGRTVVVVLHDLNLAFRYATHVVLMKGGRIVTQGAPREIVTSETIREVFDLECVVLPDPCTGTPMVVPRDQDHDQDQDQEEAA